MTRKTLQSELGITHSQLSLLINNKRSTRFELMERISSFLKVPLSILLEENILSLQNETSSNRGLSEDTFLPIVQIVPVVKKLPTKEQISNEDFQHIQIDSIGSIERGNKVFALKMPDKGLSGKIPKGTIIVFNPEIEPNDGDIVVMGLKEKYLIRFYYDKGDKVLLLGTENTAPELIQRDDKESIFTAIEIIQRLR